MGAGQGGARRINDVARVARELSSDLIQAPNSRGKGSLEQIRVFREGAGDVIEFRSCWKEKSILESREIMEAARRSLEEGRWADADALAKEVTLQDLTNVDAVGIRALAREAMGETREAARASLESGLEAYRAGDDAEGSSRSWTKIQKLDSW